MQDRYFKFLAVTLILGVILAFADPFHDDGSSHRHLPGTPTATVTVQR